MWVQTAGRAAAIALLVATASTGVAEERDREIASRGKAAKPAVAGEIDPPYADSEEGCLEGRIKDYLDRHGDYGVINPESVLYETQRVKDEIEQNERHRGPRALSISGTVWTNIGPTNGAGRITAVAPHPTLTGNLIVGAAGGGAWKSTDSGATWTALTDSIANLSVGAIAYAPSNTNIVYLGTGEGGYGYDFIPGIGLLKSTDGGTNWTTPSSVVANMFYRILVHPTNPDELLIATDLGCLRSTAGQNGAWTSVISGTYGDVTDLVRDPTNANVVYAATSDPTPKVLKSVDAGQTWSEVVTGLPVTGGGSTVGRMALAIAPSNTQVLYVAFEIATTSYVSHIYKTVNGGTNWTATNLSTSTRNNYLNGQGWYDNTIVVSPSDPNVVIAGGVFYARSVDGGTTWASPTFTVGAGLAGVHVDAHDLRFDMNNTLLYIGNDGGVWTSGDAASAGTANNLTTATPRNTNLVTRQFYGLSVDPVNRNRVFGGQQDNGSLIRRDTGGTTWDFFHHSDGFQGAVNERVPSIAYASTQYGTIVRTKRANVASPAFPPMLDRSPIYEGSDSTPFFTVVKVDPSTPSTMYTGTQRVWKSKTGGDSWLPLPTTGFTGSSQIHAIAVAKSNPLIIIVSKYNQVFRSTDGGNTWTLTSTGLPGKYITSIEIDPADSSKAYASVAGQSGSSVYCTLNGGTNWTACGTGLPAFSTQVVRIDPTTSSRLFAGTDVGVYESTNSGGNWSRFGTGMPAVSVYDLQATADGAILRAATHGRGIWELTVTGVTNTVPAVAISSPATQTISRGASLTFTGTFSDPDGGDSATATWNFADTWTSTNATSGGSLSHQFDRPGRWPITLTATDTHGASNAAVVDIIVTEAGESCANPIIIPAAGPFPYTVTVTTEESTRENSAGTAVDPNPVVPNPGSCHPFTPFNGIWVQFTPTVGGSYTVSSCGSKASLVIAAFENLNVCGTNATTFYDGLVKPVCLASSIARDDCSTDTTAVTFSTTAGVPYRFFLTNRFFRDYGQVSMTITNAGLAVVPMAVDPPLGDSAGGTAVTITGSGFTGTPVVNFGGTAATGVTVVTPQLLKATTPAHAAGLVDLQITNASGPKLQSAFTFVDGIPVVTITANDNTATEAGTTTGQFTVARTGSTAAALDVTLTVGGTATNTTDYSTISTTVTIPAGQASQTITVTPVDDALAENSETVILTVVAGTGYTVGASSSATVTIASDDVDVTITANDNTATEAGPTNGQFTVTRNGGSAAASLTVNLTVSGTATNGTDYTTINTTVTIPAGLTSQTITITPIDDSTVENNETVILTIASGTGYNVATPSSATVNITSDDLPVITITANDNTATEAGQTTGQYTVSRTGPTTASLLVNLTFSGTAGNGGDYTTISSSILIVGSSQTITLTPTDDAVAESDETAIVTVATGSGYVVGSPSSATVTITSDDVDVTITANDNTATEAGPTTGQFTVTRFGGSTAASLTANLTISGTATNGTDYTTINTTVTIAAGQTFQTITVTPTDDALVEANETVVVAIATGTGYNIGSPANATVTITSDDLPVVTITANDNTATEAGATTGQYTVSRTGPTTSSLVVNLAISGTATNGTDYTTIASTVTIPAAASSQTITLTPTDDAVAENDETAIVDIGSGSGYVAGGASSATVTITSDDVDVTITANDSTATEAGATTGQFTVMRFGGSMASSLVVNLTITGTATNGTDYNTINATVTISAAASSQTITVTPIDDALPEGNETAVVAIATGTGYNVGTASSATVTIADDDLPVVTITANDDTATEAGQTTGQYTVSRTGSTTSSLVVNLTISGTATNGTDYTTIGATVTIPAAASSQTITLTPTDDAVAESDETAIIDIATSSGYVAGSSASATVTITSDDVDVTITANDNTATEAGTTTGQFTVTRFGGSMAASLTVNLSISGGATNGSDYTTINATVTIPAAASSQTITVTPVDDSVVEADETVVVAIATGTGYNAGSPSSATVTIASDDLPVITITANDNTATEVGPTTGQYTVSRTGPTTSSLVVNLTIGGDATSVSDYSALATTVTIPAAASSQTITLTPVDDSAVENDETVIVSIASGTGYVAGNPSSATVTIQSEDTSVAITANDSSATEAGTTTGQFTVTRSGPTTSALSVNLTIGGTATNGTDYATINSTVTISAGQASQTITVTPTDDAVAETDETVLLTVASGTGYVVGSPNNATVTITSDDVDVTITANDSTASEAGATTGQFTVTRFGGTNAASLSVNLSIGGTATNGSDYNTIGSTVTIGAGQASQTITVTPIDDAAVESDETVVLTISSGTGYNVGSPGNATVTIASDDAGDVSIAANDSTATEAGPTNGQFTLTRTGSTASSILVNVTFGGTATNGSDYSMLTTPVLITGGSATATLNVVPINDSAVEADETVTITVVSGSGYNVGAPSVATVTITSDDLAAAPSNLVATATSTTSVSLTWTAAGGATQYEIWRAADNAAFGVLTSVSGAFTSYTDNTATANHVYVYRVRAVVSSSFTAFSNADPATTLLFADDPVVPGTTVIRAAQVTEMRNAANLLRMAVGLANATFTDTTLTAGMSIRKVHVEELRTALTQAYAVLGMTPSYTDGSLTGVRVKAVHLMELRALVK